MLRTHGSQSQVCRIQRAGQIFRDFVPIRGEIIAVEFSFFNYRFILKDFVDGESLRWGDGMDQWGNIGKFVVGEKLVMR